MSTARVDFTRGAAERIASAVRKVEQGSRDQAPLTFRRIDDPVATPGGVKLGTFEGQWFKDSFKIVTVVGGSATYSVKNVTLPIDMDDKSPNTATRKVLFSKVAGEYHAVEFEQGGICGEWKEYLITLGVSNCSGSGAIAIVQDVNIGTTPAPASNSGAGAVSSISLQSGGSNYAQRGREAPVLSVAAQSTNVSFTISYQQLAGTCNLPYWKVSNVVAGGDTTFWTPQTLSVVPQNEPVEIEPAVLNLTTAGVSIISGGAYYKESNALPPYTHAMSVSVLQPVPSLGSGAVFTPVVDLDPTSLGFGQVTSITIDNGGNDYIAWVWNGSIPFGSVDLSLINDFKSYEKQVLGHEGSCLKWFSVETCATNL